MISESGAQRGTGNRSRLLRLVHESGPLSRARLTELTGLNRSTISTLVADLVERGQVVEDAAPGGNRVGRPSPIVSPHQAPVAFTVNPEIDALTVGLVGRNARVDVTVRHPVDHALSPEETVELAVSLLARLRAGAPDDRRVIGVGIAVPGLVRLSDGTVRWAPHLDWRDAGIATMMSEATGLPSWAANDASLGAVAEHLFGVARGISDLVYLNGGASGIGGGVISSGRLLGGANGFAGEFGRTRVVHDDPSSARLLEQELDRSRLLEVSGLIDADEPTLAAALLDSTDPAVETELSRQRRVLSVAIGNAVDVLDPELVVLGGFLSTVFRSGSAEVIALVRRHASEVSDTTGAIRSAALGPELLMIGAAELVFDGVPID